VSAPTDPDELRAEIARTRADLGATAQALAAKADVKARAKEAAADRAGRAKEAAAEAAGRAKVAAAEAAGRAKGQLVTVQVQAADRFAPVRQRVAATSRNPAVRRALPPAAVAAVCAVLIAGALAAFRRARA
jgi:hypothetical protein